jgi:hypothetical protein
MQGWLSLLELMRTEISGGAQLFNLFNPGFLTGLFFIRAECPFQKASKKKRRSEI